MTNDKGLNMIEISEKNIKNLISHKFFNNVLLPVSKRHLLISLTGELHSKSYADLGNILQSIVELCADQNNQRKEKIYTISQLFLNNCEEVFIGLENGQPLQAEDFTAIVATLTQ